MGPFSTKFESSGIVAQLLSVIARTPGERGCRPDKIRFDSSKRYGLQADRDEEEREMTITIDDFQKVDMRVGRIINVEEFPEARKPSLKLTIDFGSLGTRRSSAGLKQYYTPEELLGRQVICVVNFPPRRVAGFPSEVLILGATQEDGRIILLEPDAESELGSPIA